MFKPRKIISPEEKIGLFWLYEWQNYKDEEYNGYITSVRINKLIKLNLLISDTLNTITESRDNFIFWLKEFLPDEQQLDFLDKKEAQELLIKKEQLLALIATQDMDLVKKKIIKTMKRIDMAREKINSLVTQNKDYFFMSVGLDEDNSGYACYWDENNKQPIQLVVVGLLFSIRYFVGRLNNKQDRRAFSRLFIQKIIENNGKVPNLESLLKIFKEKFCVCIFIQKERSLEVISSGDLTDNEIIELLVFTYQFFVGQLDSDEEVTDFFKKLLSNLEIFIEGEQIKIQNN